MTNPLHQRLRQAARRLGLQPPLALTPAWGLGEYAIGTLLGADPLQLDVQALPQRPALTAREVTDVPASLVADPFIIFEQNEWHMFFEVCDARNQRGLIGWATSADGLGWRYRQVVLRQDFHLSYPFILRHAGRIYMIPESSAAGGVDLYVADPFPVTWHKQQRLLAGPWTDPTIVQFEGLWWMFISNPASDALHLFFASKLEGPWCEHPQSPLRQNDRRCARPAGPILNHAGTLVRLAQDCVKVYGHQVRAFKICRLTTTEYAEEEWAGSPVLVPGRHPWNELMMHHLCAAPHNGTWLAAVDGFGLCQPDYPVQVLFANGMALHGLSRFPLKGKYEPGDELAVGFHLTWPESFVLSDLVLQIRFINATHEIKADCALEQLRLGYFCRCIQLPRRPASGSYRVEITMYAGKRHAVVPIERQHAACVSLRDVIALPGAHA